VKTLAMVATVLCWIGFFYPFVFRAPHWQKRGSVVASGSTAIGILFETAAVLTAWTFRAPEQTNMAHILLGVAFGALGAAVARSSVLHLGRQFRVRAGLWEDHELVRTGPYAVVRHPIYAALFCELLATILMLTRWPWWVVSIVLYIVGTEVRVRTEDALLASRFGAQFEAYRRAVRAYIPFVR
jgi:isoprenylcysteine carboxyl methyltransferase (ICMT) family protein YpbQ